jgi:hypothetical protein
MPALAFRRVPVAQQARQRQERDIFVAPTKGWIANENLAASKKGGAQRLENWFPTQNSIRLRAGSGLFATIGTDPVTALFTYKSGSTERFFAADAANIFDITSVADPETAPTASVSGQNGGDYSTEPFETAAGDFLYAVNGADLARLYDGTRFRVVNDTAQESIDFDAKTGDFTVGLVLSGAMSGATADIIDIMDNGDGTGTLYLQNVASGPFQNNETITDTDTGSADADGVNGAYSSIVITGVATDALSQVNVYRNRYYFIEGGTMSAWYLPVDSLGGAATEISLRGVFKKGGSLLLMATWSLDAGDGVDDKAVFISTEGEAAVYEGSYPGGSDWSLVGRYDLSPPLGKQALMRAGGDLLIATKEGIIPFSAVLTKDPAALSLAAVTRAIEPEWKKELLTRGTTLPYALLKWPSYNLAIVALPTQGSLSPYCFVVNVETGAWCKYTGWDTRCLGLFADWAYFGTADGTILKCESTGSDNGNPYECVCVHLWSQLGAIGPTHLVYQMRSTFIASRAFTAKASISVNYVVSLPAAPAAAAVDSSDVWDTGLWDTAIWDAAGEKSVTTRWTSIGKTGFVVAPQMQITCGQTIAPDAELISQEIVYEHGGLVV